MYLNGSRIKKHMKDLGMNHLQFAVFAKVSPSTIWSIISREETNTTSEVNLRIFRLLYHEGKVKDFTEILDLNKIKLAKEQ
jgi:predicted transcriptional regulator